MIDFSKSPYSSFLEEMVRYIYEIQPTKIAVVATDLSGDTMTAYYQADAQDKAVFAHHIYSDAVMDVVVNNIGTIKDALDEYGEGENDD